MNLDMRLGEIATVVLMYQLGDPSKVARVLGVDERRLNDRLRRAERQIGDGDLVERYRRPVRLTEAGRRHLPALRAIYESALLLRTDSNDSNVNKCTQV